jgi:hypothetical protein
MESNNGNSNYGEGQQLRSSPRKRKFNELATDGPPAATETEEEQKQQQPSENLSEKKRGNENDDDDLEVCVRNLNLYGKECFSASNLTIKTV